MKATEAPPERLETGCLALRSILSFRGKYNLTNTIQTVVWGQNAHQWSRVGPPLKPSSEDTDLTLVSLRPLLDGVTYYRKVAILGVTPELVQLPWPADVELMAFDHSAHMIEQVWLPNPLVPSSIHQSDWAALPLESSSLMAVVGDGSFNALPSLNSYRDVLAELHRVMVPEALVIVRCFIRPDNVESLDEVVAAVQLGRVGSFHALKWRLAMSLADVPGAGVPVSDIHTAFEDCFPSRIQLAKQTGWSLLQIDTIDAYQDAATRYNFPTLTEMHAQCTPYFKVQDVRYATYELADRCPTLTLRCLDFPEAQL